MSILDPKFQYKPSFNTNVGKTIERERKRLKALKEQEEANRAEVAAKVEKLPKKAA